MHGMRLPPCSKVAASSSPNAQPAYEVPPVKPAPECSVGKSSDCSNHPVVTLLAKVSGKVR